MDKFDRFKAWLRGEYTDGSRDYHGLQSAERFERFEQTAKAKELRKKALGKERD